MAKINDSPFFLGTSLMLRTRSGPHPHELHAVVQRRLSAKQKQEVFFLRQHHGGQLEEEELCWFCFFYVIQFTICNHLRIVTTVDLHRHLNHCLFQPHFLFLTCWFKSYCWHDLDVSSSVKAVGARTSWICRRLSAAASNLSLSRLIVSSVISSLWKTNMDTMHRSSSAFRGKLIKISALVNTRHLGGAADVYSANSSINEKSRYSVLNCHDQDLTLTNALVSEPIGIFGI